MKHGFTTSVQSQIGSHPSGQQPANLVRSDQKGNSTLGCAWYFIHRLPLERKIHQYRILHGVIGAFKGRNREKTAPNRSQSWDLLTVVVLHFTTPIKYLRQ